MFLRSSASIAIGNGGFELRNPARFALFLVRRMRYENIGEKSHWA